MANEDEFQGKNDLNEPPMNKRQKMVPFKEMTAEDITALSKAGAENIRQAVQMTLEHYGVTQEELNKWPKSHRITITRYE